MEMSLKKARFSFSSNLVSPNENLQAPFSLCLFILAKAFHHFSLLAHGERTHFNASSSFPRLDGQSALGKKHDPFAVYCRYFFGHYRAKGDFRLPARLS